MKQDKDWFGGEFKETYNVGIEATSSDPLHLCWIGKGKKNDRAKVHVIVGRVAKAATDVADHTTLLDLRSDIASVET